MKVAGNWKKIWNVMLTKSAASSTESASKGYDNPSFQHDEDLEQSDQLKTKKKM